MELSQVITSLSDKYMGASTNSPTNPLPYLFASNISLNSGDKAGAKDYLTKAVTLKSNYSDVPGLAKEIQALAEKLNKGTVSSVISTDNSSTASPKPKKVEPVK